jgi:hypothetical protein
MKAALHESLRNLVEVIARDVIAPGHAFKRVNVVRLKREQHEQTKRIISMKGEPHQRRLERVLGEAFCLSSKRAYQIPF